MPLKIESCFSFSIKRKNREIQKLWNRIWRITKVKTWKMYAFNKYPGILYVFWAKKSHSAFHFYSHRTELRASVIDYLFVRIIIYKHLWSKYIIKVCFHKWYEKIYFLLKNQNVVANSYSFHRYKASRKSVKFCTNEATFKTTK